MIEDGELSYVKIECPTSAYSTGDIIIMADALPSFVEGLNKMDAAMNAFKRKVHEKNYSNVKTEITGFPNVSYRWDVGQHLQQNAPFEFTVEVDDRGNFKLATMITVTSLRTSICHSTHSIIFNTSPCY